MFFIKYIFPIFIIVNVVIGLFTERDFYHSQKMDFGKYEIWNGIINNNKYLKLDNRFVVFKENGLYLNKSIKYTYIDTLNHSINTTHTTINQVELGTGYTESGGIPGILFFTHSLKIEEDPQEGIFLNESLNLSGILLWLYDLDIWNPTLPLLNISDVLFHLEKQNEKQQILMKLNNINYIN